MTLRNYINVIGVSFISLLLLATKVSANSYTSEVFSSINQCNQQKEKNNNLYPNFYRSDCVESSDGKFYYNICDTNYCIANQGRSELVENKANEVYQHDNINTTISNTYILDNTTNEKIQQIAE
jgi:hypothetical protein